MLSRVVAVASTLVVLAGLITTAPPVQAQSPAIERSVFHLVVITPDGDGWKSYASGTGFFVAPDGTSLTNAHVVYPVVRFPDRYKLLVLLDGVFYGADVECSTRLRHDPMTAQPGPVELGRDLARIRVKLPAFAFSEWGIRAQGEFLSIARRPEGSLPAFQPLAIGPAPRPGETIRVLGFGQISAIPRRWSTSGRVDEFHNASDGTRVFTVRFTLPPQPGNSGSPVLNAQGTVVGIWTWTLIGDEAIGVAIAGPELQNPCR